MKLSKKLYLVFLTSATLIGIVGVLSYDLQTRIHREYLSRLDLGLDQLEETGQMVQALQSAHLAIPQFIEDYPDSFGGQGNADELRVYIEAGRENLQTLTSTFLSSLNRLQAIQDDRALTDSSTVVELSPSDDLGPLLFARLRTEFQIYEEQLDDFFRLAYVDVDAANSRLEMDIEPTYHDVIFPIVERIIQSSYDEVKAASTSTIQRARSNGRVILLISALAILSAAVLGAVFTKTFSKRIGKLEKVAYGIGHGKFDALVEITSQDEIGTLAAAINRMSANLNRTMVSISYVDNIIHSMADALIVTDVDGRIQKVNQATLSLLGYDKEDLLNHAVSKIFLDSAMHDVLVKKEIEVEKIVRNLETSFRSKKGIDIPVSLSGAHMYDSDGKVTGVVYVVKDITERKMFEVELVETKEAAEEMSRLKSSFLANMSHEIRTPLTAIIGISEILVEETPEEHREFAELIVQGGKRLMDTLNSVLELAKLESETIQLNLMPYNVIQEIQKSVSLYTVPAKNHGLYCTFEATSVTPIWIMADHAALSRALSNLITNAIKFTDEGGVNVVVDGKGTHVEIRVEDTGIGIDEAFLSHVFEEFQQESHGMSREYEGSGLGLTITKRLVEQMGGIIRVQSLKGRGSIFTMSFPRIVHPDTKPFNENDDIDVQDIRGSTSYRPDTLTARILIIDDIRESALITMNMLQPYVSKIAHTLGDALMLTRQENFDAVIITSNTQSELTEAGILEELRTVPECEKIPAIALLVSATSQEANHYIASKFDGYLYKPINRENLIRTVSEVLPVSKSDL